VLRRDPLEPKPNSYDELEAGMYQSTMAYTSYNQPLPPAYAAKHDPLAPAEWEHHGEAEQTPQLQGDYPGYFPPDYEISPSWDEQKMGTAVPTKLDPLSGQPAMFTGIIRSNRFRRFIGINTGFEVAYTREPMEFEFVQAHNGSYFIRFMWRPIITDSLKLGCEPGPSYLVANKSTGQYVTRHHGEPGEDGMWELVKNKTGISLLNVKSRRFMSTHHKGVMANRREAKEWESFSIDTKDTKGVPSPMPYVDIIMTYSINFRARIVSLRFHQLVGVKKKGQEVSFVEKNSVWDFIHTPDRNAYYIRNVDKPHVFWSVDEGSKSSRIKVRDHKEARRRPELGPDCQFQLAFQGKHYFFRSFYGRFAAADSGIGYVHGRMFANRKDKGYWEAFSIYVIEQLPDE
jgi:hypothetical protein